MLHGHSLSLFRYLMLILRSQLCQRLLARHFARSVSCHMRSIGFLRFCYLLRIFFLCSWQEFLNACGWWWHIHFWSWRWFSYGELSWIERRQIGRLLESLDINVG